MRYKKIIFGILIICMGLFSIILINMNKSQKPDNIYWAKEEFENEWKDEDYYHKESLISQATRQLNAVIVLKFNGISMMKFL